MLAFASIFTPSAPAAAITRIYADSHLAAPDVGNARFTATPTLTRRRRTIQRGRLFILGDAAGYIEPFTGEGIAWALASAAAIVPHILAHVRGQIHFLRLEQVLTDSTTAEPIRVG